MAKTTSVWGLEIGQSALKALRCSSSGDQVVAEAFDYIEYPKILSQQDAEPETMIREALQTFAARNDLKNSSIALSVAGQNGLAKFFKPPPVELKKMADIVKYEARQQIPFDLRDVVWDYQLMAGGMIEDGFALESEVGLFAMKRDAVYRALKPLRDADIEIDLLQLAPLSIYNAITYDRGLIAEEASQYDAEHPPKSVVVIAMGTDATDLIVTNGYRLWQRSMPLGGNHFTRQLTKDLKLTFAKAEHLKRNALEADDPKLVFQAMRPVFNDLATEVQRSIGFFRSLHKKDEIGSILMLGNSVRLPGLPQYLSKTLSMDVTVVDTFQRLTGDEVLSAPAFKDHAVTFAPVYGLCLQALDRSAIYTNLIPQELFSERLVRAKKPWAVAAAATLLFGLAGSLLPAGSSYKVVHPDVWNSAVSSADSTKSASDTEISEDKKLLGQVELLERIGQEVSGSRDRRLLWLELLSAMGQALDRPADFDPSKLPDPKEVPLNQRETIFVTKVDNKFFKDLSGYKTQTESMYEADKNTRLELLGLLKPEPVDAATGDSAEDSEFSSDFGTASVGDTASEGDGESGWVVQIEGYHFHNDDKEGSQGYRTTGDELQGFVLKRLVDRLETGSAKLPVVREDGELELVEFTFEELGISRPFVVGDGTFNPDHRVPNPEYRPRRLGEGGPGGMGPGGMGMGGMGMGGMGMGGPGGGGMGPGGLPGGSAGSNKPLEDENGNPEWFAAPKFSFQLQFIWRERPLNARLEAQRIAAEEAARQEAESEAAAASGDEDLAFSQ
jgi:type IV pilus assembly protein PilM